MSFDMLCGYLRWKFELIVRAFEKVSDPGGHRFVRGKCRCGRTVCDDPEKCRYWE